MGGATWEPGLRSWVAGANASGFGLQALPYGVFSDGSGHRRVGVAIGDHVLDAGGASRAGLVDDAVPGAAALLDTPTLNPLMAAGPDVWRAVRARLQSLLSEGDEAGDRHRSALDPLLHPRSAVALHLPFDVADYVDFYASIHHATNLGRMFRPGGEALLPNWRYVPIGYHGRAGTVVVSGTPIARPVGQVRLPDGTVTVQPSAKLDIELEVGFVVGVPSRLGEPVPPAAFADHVFGVVLVNDWSARDIQAWEYQPLGPFLGKSFGTSVSAWVLPLAALEPVRVPGPPQDPEPFPYLRGGDDWGLDVELEVAYRPAGDGPGSAETVVARVPFAGMYWTPAQMLAHMTSNGASLRTGDLFASGTVSGPEPHQRGSLIELTWNGAEPLALAGGVTRTFLEDGDEIVLRGAFSRDGVRIELGEVRGTIHAARA